MTEVKICGLTRAEDAVAACDSGADYLGFIHFQASPRHIDLVAAELLGPQLPHGPSRVGVLVDADIQTVRAFRDALSLTWLQLHGPQSPQEIRAIKDVLGVRVIKAVSVATADDVASAAAYDGIADRILFDAKAPQGATRPGGNAVSFPWALMQDWLGEGKWLLAGGLTPETVAGAIGQAGAPGVDVATGVEIRPGIKSHDKIKAFIEAAKGAS